MTLDNESGLSYQFLETLAIVHNNFYRRKQIPIPLNQFGVLMALMKDNPKSLTNISQQLNISKQHTTSVVDRMVESGLVQKASDPADGRKVLISCTAAGDKLLAMQDEQIRHIFLEHIHRLTDGEIEELSSAISSYNRLLTKMFGPDNEKK